MSKVLVGTGYGKCVISFKKRVAVEPDYKSI